jgi:phosphate transport system ATP-binding protein
MYTVFMMIDNPHTRTGRLVEYGETSHIFTRSKNKQTEDYVTGRFG